MTKDEFIRKWLANKDFQYCEEGLAQMREDLDKVMEVPNMAGNCKCIIPHPNVNDDGCVLCNKPYRA